MQQQLSNLIGQTDIYLVDQILKGRYKTGDIILDAGCGGGRNMHWFTNNHFTIFGADADASALEATQLRYPLLPASRLVQASCDAMPFPETYFQHVICSAVLHFAESEQHFLQMIHELLRVLNIGGTLFIRMASVFGIEHMLTIDATGHSILPDGTQRFLLNDYLLNMVIKRFNLQLAEPIKTTIVHGQRCMTTLVLSKI
jgi:ubiquinone/menaquinone biosynthesis C-methylase UbiE